MPDPTTPAEVAEAYDQIEELAQRFVAALERLADRLEDHS